MRELNIINNIFFNILFKVGVREIHRKFMNHVVFSKETIGTICIISSIIYILLYICAFITYSEAIYVIKNNNKNNNIIILTKEEFESHMVNVSWNTFKINYKYRKRY